MAIRLAGMRLLDLQEAVAIRIQCSLPDVLRLDLMTQLKLMNDTGLISVASMQQLACSPAILQQYQQQMFFKPSWPPVHARLGAPHHITHPLTKACSAIAPSQVSTATSDQSLDLSGGCSTVTSNPAYTNLSDSASSISNVVPLGSERTGSSMLPSLSTTLGMPVYSAIRSSRPNAPLCQSPCGTQDCSALESSYAAATATAADAILHFATSPCSSMPLSQADGDLANLATDTACQPLVFPVLERADPDLPIDHWEGEATSIVYDTRPTSVPHSTLHTGPSQLAWEVDVSEELLAELVDLDALEQLLPAAPTGADGDISHTKNFAELGRAFDQAINASAEPMDTLASWQSSLGMAQPQLDLGLPTCSVAQPDFVTKPQPLDTNKPGLAALDNLVAFGMEDCSNPMPLCRSQPQDFRGSCITQSYTSYRTTAPTALRVTPTTPADPTQTPVCLKRSPTLEKADSRPLSRPGKRRCNVTGNVDPHAKDPSHVCLPVCKRSKATRPLSAIAENERRRVANMSPTRAEHVRQLAREATRRRKNRQRQTMKQLQRAVVELELKQRGLVGEQASLEKERQRLYTLVRKQNTKMVSC
eukprot:m.41736 g.41736  ORF g.41736 m.41736 type:complete len:590 (+) comp12844_c0_seq21:140-1909(+)